MLRNVILLVVLIFAINCKVHDVIIVGAGISGLRASQILTEEGYDHLVLESSSTIGGRIKGYKYKGLEIDIGATTIH